MPGALLFSVYNESNPEKSRRMCVFIIKHFTKE